MGTIVFDGISLNPNMEWLERGQFLHVAQTMRYTLGGRPVVQAGQLLGGIPITLEATDDHGWLQGSVVSELLERAAVLGGQYLLQFDDLAYQVMFRHQDEPAVDMRAIVPRVTHDPDDYYIGQIKLMTF